MKKVLITGSNSYIGMSVENWLLASDMGYIVDTLDMVDPEWINFDFSNYDVVFHVAGIAHFSKDVRKKELYHKVNTELTFQVASKAKTAGIKQFIFMSSIIVYGDSTSNKRIISADTSPSPTDFYGESKWQAEVKISGLSDESFKIAIIRPPMIYGKGSKGNYPRLSNLAKKIPIFPFFENQRSMLHIDNLCEFVKQLIERELEGVFFPQNSEYVCTSNLVKTIAEQCGCHLYLTKIFNPFIRQLFFYDTVKKMFGNLTYEKTMSQYDFEYQVRNFEESVILTERK